MKNKEIAHIAEDAAQEIVATIVMVLNVKPDNFELVGQINKIAAAIQGTVERAIHKGIYRNDDS